MTTQNIVNDLILDNQNLVIEELMKPDNATIINGYRILPQFAIGVGIGLQGYAIDYGEMTIPIFAHLRSDFLNGTYIRVYTRLKFSTNVLKHRATRKNRPLSFYVFLFFKK